MCEQLTIIDYNHINIIDVHFHVKFDDQLLPTDRKSMLVIS